MIVRASPRNQDATLVCSCLRYRMGSLCNARSRYERRHPFVVAGERHHLEDSSSVSLTNECVRVCSRAWKQARDDLFTFQWRGPGLHLNNERLGRAGGGLWSAKRHLLLCFWFWSPRWSWAPTCWAVPRPCPKRAGKRLPIPSRCLNAPLPRRMQHRARRRHGRQHRRRSWQVEIARPRQAVVPKPRRAVPRRRLLLLRVLPRDLAVPQVGHRPAGQQRRRQPRPPGARPRRTAKSEVAVWYPATRKSARAVLAATR